ncbi:unknown [Prevotella sp. CAG:1031]|nr:unknown [Prevotella sp. CAG:1031]
MVATKTIKTIANNPAQPRINSKLRIDKLSRLNTIITIRTMAAEIDAKAMYFSRLFVLSL